MLPTERDALQTVNTFMTHVLCSRFDEARSMFVGDVDTLPLPTTGENERIVYSLHAAEADGETVVVPTEIELDSPGTPRKQTISFVCVNADGGTKIDMDATLRRTLGASPADALAAVGQPLVEVAHETEAALEKIEDDEPAPELYSPEFLTDEFRTGMGRIEDRFDSELESIADALDNEDLVWQFAWGTMCDDEQCPQRLLGSVISPLRTALRMLEDHRSQDPDAAKDASIKKVRASIKTIDIINANDHRLCECSLREGRLVLMPCLMPSMENPMTPTKGFTAEEIEWGIRDALDLDIGPAIKRTESAVAGFIAKCGKDVGTTPTVTVDWESFRAIATGQDALNALKRLRDDLLESVHYTLFHLKKKVPLDACLESLVFRHVENVDDRAITADGKTITFSVPLVTGSTCYTTEKVQQILADLLKPLPVPQSPEPTPEAGPAEETEVDEDEVVEVAEHGPAPQDAADAGQTAASEFQQMVASMESDMMGPMRDQMSQLFGREFALDVDWESMDQEQDHFNLVVSGAMGAVMGALMVMAYNPATKEPLVAVVNGMALRYDKAVRGIALSLDEGTLHVACGGPASDFTPDPAAMGEAITALLQQARK